MSYPVEYRKRVLEYIAEGKEITRSARLFKSEELIAYVEDHPFATLAEEIAAHFGGSISGAHDALRSCIHRLKYLKKSDKINLL